jgi:hypothetical protein
MIGLSAIYAFLPSMPGLSCMCLMGGLNRFLTLCLQSCFLGGLVYYPALGRCISFLDGTLFLSSFKVQYFRLYVTEQLR